MGKLLREITTDCGRCLGSLNAGTGPSKAQDKQECLCSPDEKRRLPNCTASFLVCWKNQDCLIIR